jgi:hypothetical protein
VTGDKASKKWHGYYGNKNSNIGFHQIYLNVWDFWLQQISSISSSVLYLTIMGNHEMDFPGIPGNFGEAFRNCPCAKY